MLYIIVVSKWRKKQLFTAFLDHHCKLKGNYGESNSAFIDDRSFVLAYDAVSSILWTLVNCFHDKFDWKLCTMHKTSISYIIFKQNMPKIAENRQLQISIFPKPIEMWLHGLGGVFWMGWSPFPPYMMARYLKTQKPPWLLARSHFSSFLSLFLAKKRN